MLLVLARETQAREIPTPGDKTGRQQLQQIGIKKQEVEGGCRILLKMHEKGRGRAGGGEVPLS